ncbi:MAG: Bug family tripartite tricarboxylate transporter substrate binding protein [Pseudomonadota bacterium]
MDGTRGGVLRPVGLAAVVWALAISPALAQASDPGAFLKGEVVKLVVGFAAGGGYDLYARMFGPHFEKMTGSTVVVENRPGGGNLTALNQVVRAKPDGLTMMLLNGEAAVISQLTKQPAVGYDLLNVGILGRVTSEPRIFILRSGLPFRSLKDVLASGQKLKFSATSRIDSIGDVVATTCEALQMGCQIITGYKGSREAALAAMSGEADALIISEGSAADYLQGGLMTAIATIDRQRSELFPQLTTVFEQIALADERAWWIDFRLRTTHVGRVLVAPPNLAKERLDYLRGVWRTILNDPGVVGEGGRTQRPIRYEPPETIEAMVRELLQALGPDQLREVNEVLLKKHS